MTKRKKKRPLSRKRQDRKPLVGIAWYTPEQFERLKEVADDPDAMDDTHNEWLINATNTMRRLKKEGHQVKKVPLDIDEWVAWCQQHDKPLTRASRSQYTSEKASEGAGITSLSGQYVSRQIKLCPNPSPFLDQLETPFEAERDKSSPPPYPFDPNRNVIRLPKEVVDDLRRLIRTGQKIEAVKQVAKLTGAGLRVAKDYADRLVG